MATEQVKAEMLRGYRMFFRPETPTVAVLRLDTDNEQHWVMVTWEILELLAADLAEKAQKIERTQ